MSSAQPGIILNGKYRLESSIGRGGMGWVWRAEHLQWHAPVAIKLIDLRRAHSATGDEVDLSPQIQRFFSEARAAASIRSPHVVQILDHGVDPTSRLPFIVMELLEGETLEARLDRDKQLHPSLAANLLTQVARALGRVHEANMIHRDLKPSNIFLVPNDDEVVVKVLDFGIAKSLQANAGLITATGEQVGTPFYMSPEQVRGHRDIDFRADIWSFGVIAFECLTGQRPFDGETLGDLSLKICVEPLPVPSSVALVPTGFDAWFLRCVERDRERRFASAREAADALRAVLQPAARSGDAVQFTPQYGRHSQTSSAVHPLASTTAATSSAQGRVRNRSKRLKATAVAVSMALGIVAVAVNLTKRTEPHAELEAPLTEAAGAAAQLPATPHTFVADARTESPGAEPTQGSLQAPKLPPPAVQSVTTVHSASGSDSPPSPPRKHEGASSKAVSPRNAPSGTAGGSPNGAAADKPSPSTAAQPKSLHDLIESRY